MNVLKKALQLFIELKKEILTIFAVEIIILCIYLKNKKTFSSDFIFATLCTIGLILIFYFTFRSVKLVYNRMKGFADFQFHYNFKMSNLFLKKIKEYIVQKRIEKTAHYQTQIILRNLRNQNDQLRAEIKELKSDLEGLQYLVFHENHKFQDLKSISSNKEILKDNIFTLKNKFDIIEDKKNTKTLTQIQKYEKTL